MNVFDWLPDYTLFTWLVIIATILFVVVTTLVIINIKLNALLKILLIAIPQVCVYLFYKYFLYYTIQLHLVVLVPSFFITFFMLLITSEKKQEPKDPIWSVPLLLKNGKKLFLENIKRGVIIFGSAGSGKTESVFVPFLKHAAGLDMPVLCYDYKDGELTEIANFFYSGSKIKKSVVIPHKPIYSDRVNPFHPKYISNEQHLRQQTKLIFSNLKKGESSKNSGNNNFFDKIPESTLAAVIWRLKTDFPDCCTLPHAVAICLSRNPRELAEFISKNTYSRAIGTPLIDSLGSDNQIAGVKASLSLPLTDLAVPSIFWVLSANEVDLDINNPQNPTFLSVVTDPQLEKVNGPFISLIISTVISNMQVRNRMPSMLLFDEGTTFSIDNISRIPATMRSYNIATVFSTQDKALSKENYGAEVTNSLLANLSYQIIGKTNDPESVKYYKQISEEIEKLNISKSYKGGMIMSGGDTRFSESKRDSSKFKNQDFTRLKPGEFFVFSDGVENKYQFAQHDYTRIESKVKHHVSETIINNHFDKIFEEAARLL